MHVTRIQFAGPKQQFNLKIETNNGDPQDRIL